MAVRLHFIHFKLEFEKCKYIDLISINVSFQNKTFYLFIFYLFQHHLKNCF